MILRLTRDKHNPVCNPGVEERLKKALVKLMREIDATAEQFTRLGLRG